MPRGDTPLVNTTPYYSHTDEPGFEDYGQHFANVRHNGAQHSTPRAAARDRSGARPHESMSYSDNRVRERQHATHMPSHAPHRSGENQRIPEDAGMGRGGAREGRGGAREADGDRAQQELVHYEDAPDDARVAAFGSCCVCLQNPADVVMSCGHLCICQNCVRHVSRCPVCRAAQEGKPVKCFLNKALAPANPYTVRV